jgi:hypothetical protein
MHGVVESVSEKILDIGLHRLNIERSEISLLFGSPIPWLHQDSMGEGVHNRCSIRTVLQAMMEAIYRRIKISDEIDVKNILRKTLS